MNPWLFLFLWIAMLVLQGLLGSLAIVRLRQSFSPMGAVSLTVSALASLPALCTFLAFLRVLVIGGSSNVVQYAGDEGAHLWSLWFDLWFPLFYTNLAALPVLFVAALLPPYPPRSWSSFCCRACALAAAGCAWWVIVNTVPDA